MNDGFKKMPISEPSILTDFIESTSGSILSIISVSKSATLKLDLHSIPYNITPQSLNNVLYNSDPDDIPITDMDAAASLPYDTDIPEDDADIPADADDALKANALRVTRIDAVAQVND